jgi:hypothetical protein
VCVERRWLSVRLHYISESIVEWAALVTYLKTLALPHKLSYSSNTGALEK